MRDVLEKYIELNKTWPNKAGKLRSLLEAQKRLLETLLKSRQSDKVKELILAVSESYCVSVDLLDYVHNVLQGVANDAEALRDGAKLRNAMKFVREENDLFWKNQLNEFTRKDKTSA